MRPWPLYSMHFPQNTLSNCSRCCRAYSATLLTQKVSSNAIPEPPPLASMLKKTDPFTIFTPELSSLRCNVLNLLGSAHPGLSELAKKSYFLEPSQQLRPVLIMLFSKATNGLGRDWETSLWNSEYERDIPGRTTELDSPLTRAGLLNDHNPNMPDYTESFEDVFPLHSSAIHPAIVQPSSSHSYTPSVQNVLLPTQLRLAQIVEMIHTASVLHKNVLDSTAQTSISPAVSNKLAVLGGDFLLGRASASLSRLGNSQVVELISSVISNIVEGQMLQAETPSKLAEAWELYSQRTYLATASLLAKGARSAVILGGCVDGEVWHEVAYACGHNLGIASQLVEDVVEYQSNLRSGVISSPVLFAWEEYSELSGILGRALVEPEDVSIIEDFVKRSSAIDRTLALARAHASKAHDMLALLPESETRVALEALCERIVQRT